MIHDVNSAIFQRPAVGEEIPTNQIVEAEAERTPREIWLIVAIVQLSYAADVPQTTALRYVDTMEEHGLVVRIPDEADKRRNWIELTPTTFDSMAGNLAQRAEGRREDGVSFIAGRRGKV